jgi:photosystem II stability/assembly factor-like uncharacterized protein
MLIVLLFPVTAPAATLYGLIDTGEIFRSTDAGVSWTALATLPVRDAVALSARLVAADLFLASRSGTVYHSGDAGFSWTAVGTIPASDVVDFVIRPDGALLVLTTSGSLFRSTDLGVTFSSVATLTAANFVSLTLATGPPGIRYYALTRTGEVYESTDAGNSWTPRGALAVSQATQICAVGSIPYVLTDTGDVYRSTDSGATWTAVGTLSQVGMRGLVRDGSSLAAASREGHVATSADGITWNWRGSMNQLTLVALATNELAQSGVGPGPPDRPFFVSGVFPNPSRGPASFRVHLAAAAGVRLALFDVSGRLVAVRREEHLGPGEHTVTWAPEVRGSGTYYLRLMSGPFAATTSWVIMR